jgi:hypothetical protein
MIDQPSRGTKSCRNQVVNSRVTPAYDSTCMHGARRLPSFRVASLAPAHPTDVQTDPSAIHIMASEHEGDYLNRTVTPKPNAASILRASVVIIPRQSLPRSRVCTASFRAITALKEVHGSPHRAKADWINCSTSQQLGRKPRRQRAAPAPWQKEVCSFALYDISDLGYLKTELCKPSRISRCAPHVRSVNPSCGLGLAKTSFRSIGVHPSPLS